MTVASRQSLARRIGGLQQALQVLFTERPQAGSRRRPAVQRKLLLGLELLWKLEEQVVLPALRVAEPGWGADVTCGTRELALLRDLAMVAAQTAPAHREVTFAVLQGMAELHFDRINDLLARPGAESADWPRLERELCALLARWQGEVQQNGDIEDEDRDPVGMPPRVAASPKEYTP
jgi:hypothetical protein